MMKITGLSHLFKWENLHNWWLTKYFFAPPYICIYIYIYIYTYIHTGAGHIIRISSKSETCIMYTFISHRLIYFKCLFLLILMIITDN